MSAFLRHEELNKRLAAMERAKVEIAKAPKPPA
jgi:hypothetical protein